MYAPPRWYGTFMFKWRKNFKFFLVKTNASFKTWHRPFRAFVQCSSCAYKEPRLNYSVYFAYFED